ncbi:RNA-dependent RNA polymerase [Mycena venus]|uniref:RNA-dependent RNA polymerase n=1 Tax=Mycena venus TaxID=2733690 RepID=A0A8H6Z5R3_9AGAR|nr:RNA-dependent RNA polymerase [Mycena venus]
MKLVSKGKTIAVVRLLSASLKLFLTPNIPSTNLGPHVLSETLAYSGSAEYLQALISGCPNKQFIVLILTLGIPLSVFEDLLHMQLDEIAKITTDRQKALDCVDGEVDAEGDGFYQELYEMLLAGHDMNELYLASQLPRFQNTSRDALRKKLNISVKVDLTYLVTGDC